MEVITALSLILLVGSFWFVRAAAGDPIANVEQINCSSVIGWAYDPDQSSAVLDIHVYFDGTGYNSYTSSPKVTTNLARSDVNTAHGITGNHGFSFSVPAQYLDNTVHTVSVYAMGVDASGNANGQNVMIKQGTITCSNGTSATLPKGFADSNTCKIIEGWAFDEDNTSKAVDIHIYIDGQGTNTGPTTVLRSDVNNAQGITGNHGYRYSVPTKWHNGQTHNTEVYAININKDGTVGSGSSIIGKASWTCDANGNTVSQQQQITYSNNDASVPIPKPQLNPDTDVTGTNNDSDPISPSGLGSGSSGGTSTGYTSAFASGSSRSARSDKVSNSFGGGGNSQVRSNITTSQERQYLFASRTTAAPRTTRPSKIQLKNNASAARLIVSKLFGGTKISVCEKNGKYISVPGGESLGPNVFEGFSQYYSFESASAISVSSDECRSTFGGTSKQLIR